MLNRPLVKLCGQTRAADIEYSFRKGADLCGVVVQVESSPRTRTIMQALELFAVDAKRTFALTANAPVSLYEEIARLLNPGYFQLTADETPADLGLVRRLGIPVFKSIHLPPVAEPGKGAETFLKTIEAYRAAGADGFVLDTKVPRLFGGSGVKSDWSLAARIIGGTDAKILLAGGISPANAAQAARLGPWAIDLASGVEDAPGIKSKEKIDDLFATLKGAA